MEIESFPKAIASIAMPHSSLLPDDLSPSDFSAEDQELSRQLEAAVRRYFYEACDGVTQALLLNCEWRLVSDAEACRLCVVAEDPTTYGRVLNNLTPLGHAVSQFVPTAVIRIYPPEAMGVPFEIRADELSI